jgi:hypothetical protein
MHSSMLGLTLGKIGVNEPVPELDALGGVHKPAGSPEDRQHKP